MSQVLMQCANPDCQRVWPYAPTRHESRMMHMVIREDPDHPGQSQLLCYCAHPSDQDVARNKIEERLQDQPLRLQRFQHEAHLWGSGRACYASTSYLIEVARLLMQLMQSSLPAQKKTVKVWAQTHPELSAACRRVVWEVRQGWTVGSPLHKVLLYYRQGTQKQDVPAGQPDSDELPSDDESSIHAE